MKEEVIKMFEIFINNNKNEIKFDTVDDMVKKYYEFKEEFDESNRKYAPKGKAYSIKR